MIFVSVIVALYLRLFSFRHCTKIYRKDAISTNRIEPKILLQKCGAMCVAVLSLQLVWVVGHVYAPSSIISALGSSAVAFSYILSWLILKHPMLIVKVFLLE